MHPGKVLTSMMKRVDVAVYDAFTRGTEQPGGFSVLNLASNGVGYAMDENNADLVSAELQGAVDAVADKIIAGDITVHDYMSDESCPALSF